MIIDPAVKTAGNGLDGMRIPQHYANLIPSV